MSFNEENIEAYLTGKLSASDKLTLEEGMRKDPLLKSEVDLQNDIIESLKNSRKIQLKNRMNNLDVSATSTGVSSAVKIAASFITVGMIGAGIYYMSIFSTNTKDKEVVTAVSENNNLNQNQSIQQYNKNNQISTPLIEKENVVIDTDKNSRSNSNVNSNATTNSNNNKTSDRNRVSKREPVAVANVPQGEIFDQEYGINKNDVTIPNGEISEAKVKKADNVEFGIDSNIKKDLSYRFSSGKLYLSKDFEEQPYELLELNTSKSKQFYLYFGNKYYEMKSNQTKATRLNEVKDNSILAVLRKLNK
ncbi:MAG TPA: hypothetical protein VNW06_02150 [Cytophagaceae bacterium]|jgi:hypothetical protein|nr:hypothetical protein [Cytophagaceae bacterium]